MSLGCSFGWCWERGSTGIGSRQIGGDSVLFAGFMVAEKVVVVHLRG